MWAYWNLGIAIKMSNISDCEYFSSFIFPLQLYTSLLSTFYCWGLGIISLLSCLGYDKKDSFFRTYFWGSFKVTWPWILIWKIKCHINTSEYSMYRFRRHASKISISTLAFSKPMKWKILDKNICNDCLDQRY